MQGSLLNVCGIDCIPLKGKSAVNQNLHAEFAQISEIALAAVSSKRLLLLETNSRLIRHQDIATSVAAVLVVSYFTPGGLQPVTTLQCLFP